MSPVQTKITLDGNFFHRDPGKTLRGNVVDMLANLAEEMERGVRDDIASHAGSMPYYTGWSLEHTRGYVVSPNTARHWQTWAAVAAVTAGMGAKDAIRTKAAAAGIEKRWHPYRRTKSGIYSARSIIQADLAKGLE